MSPIETYLADLRTALGDRLPPALVEARLREIRGHLAASSQEVGENEAVRRYGRPRVVADSLVRAQKGYDAKSVWRLALPLTTGLLLYGASETIAKVRVPRQGLPHYGALSAAAFTALLFSLGFVIRVAQTRRWLAGPMIAAQVVTLVLLGCLEHLKPQPVFIPEIRKVGPRGMFSTGTWSFGPPVPRPWSSDDLVDLSWDAYDFGAFWLILNAGTLGLAALSDRRRARRT